MKLVALLYLEEDDPSVAQLLKEHGVMAYSRLPLEGYGSGMKGWLGEVAPYQSHMAFALLPAEKAEELMEAVSKCDRCQDSRHPIHALQVDVEKAVESGVPISNSNK